MDLGRVSRVNYLRRVGQDGGHCTATENIAAAPDTIDGAVKHHHIYLCRRSEFTIVVGGV
jgi:hypothetical protein